jgi:hypothetical protein
VAGHAFAVNLGTFFRVSGVNRQGEEGKTESG